MSNLVEEYSKQWEWRNWETIFSTLPGLSKKLIYDLGCAQGDQSHKLSSMGAIVHGLDGNKNLIQYAIERGIPNTKFDLCDLKKIDSLNLPLADGIWTSFVPAYFTDFDVVLRNWKKLLKPKGWIAITEMSGLLNHHHMSTDHKKIIQSFYKESFERNRYDFESGEKIKAYLESNGFEILKISIIKDEELSFQGAATEEIVTAWNSRFERMGGFKSFLGMSFNSFKDDFISSIKRDDHVSDCKVYFYLAVAN